MLILVYAGVFLLIYGIYNTISYIFVLPTARTGRTLSEIGSNRRDAFFYTASVLLSEKIVKKWDLEWNRSEKFEEILKAKKIYVEGTVYLISRFILMVAGILWLLPMLFIDQRIFCAFFILWMLWRAAEVLRLIPIPKIWNDKRRIKRKIADIAYKLLLGAFFIAQIIVFLTMLT